ncbi:PRC-barrel domain-containing protein [Saccharopolyspora cebuensis]|uniref:PRC-barrel domain-containing protein n=1 Tax=Saccharopolyspora cebuensis TaxID=418759 RepID=A0ABV4CK88_9PSEU
MKDVERAQDLIGTPVFDRDGDRIGRVGNVYVDDVTQQPEWVTVRMGLLGIRETFVPLNGAAASEDRLDVGVSKARVKSAPRVDAEHGHLSDREGTSLFAHYGLDDADEPRTADA